MSNVAEKKQLPAYLILAIIALVAALALAITNAITSGPIKAREQAAQREAFGAVLEADSYTAPQGFDASAHGVNTLVEAKRGGETVGYCAVAAANGYASPVAVTLGVDMSGKVTGVKIGDGNFAETAGFGSRWLDKSNWTQFIGIDAVKGGTIEALSGATVTSGAVLDASNKALSAINAAMGKEGPSPVLAFGKPEAKPTAEPAVLTGEVKEGTARGFQSDVQVQVTLDDAGLISGLIIDSANETAGFGTRCGEDADFAAQFIGKAAPLALGEGIEALSGATVTSTAVVDAINAALAEPASAPVAEVTPEPTAEPTAEPVVLTGDILTGTARGFQSDVQVQVTLDEAGAITGIIINSEGETPNFGTRCGTDADFAARFIGKTAPVTVEALSGATITSNAVIVAINDAMAAAQPTPAPTAEPTVAPTTEPAPAGVAVPGFGGLDVLVDVTLAEDGAIAAVQVNADTQSPGLGKKCAEEAFLSQFIDQTGPFTLGENIDAVSYATITSQAVVDAVNTFFPAAEPQAKTVTVPAFAGQDITVNVTFAADGTIAALTVDADSQTPGLGKKVAKDTFTEQFLGQTGPFALGEGIDAVSYATITSQAVVDALNGLLAK